MLDAEKIIKSYHYLALILTKIFTCATPYIRKNLKIIT